MFWGLSGAKETIEERSFVLLSEKHSSPFVQIYDKTKSEIFGSKSLISE